MLKRISKQNIEDDYEQLSEKERDRLNKMFYADIGINLQNSLLPKIFDFHIYISYLHDDQIS